MRRVFVAVFLAFSLHGKAGMHTAAEQSNQILIATVEIRILFGFKWALENYPNIDPSASCCPRVSVCSTKVFL